MNNILEISITGNNSDLKKSLQDSRAELKKFAEEIKKSGGNSGIDALKKELNDARIAAIKFSSDVKSSLAESLNNAKKYTEGAKQATESYKQSLLDAKKAVDAQRAATESARTATEQERTATERQRTALAESRAELARLTLEKKKSQQATVAASGSYREAQQRLTALGKSIREAEGGFESISPDIQRQIKDYNDLNTRLKAFDASMGNNQRNVGNYALGLGNASGVTMEFTRIIQDAPYGMMGIGNNIQQLTSNWQIYAESSRKASAEQGRTITTGALLRGALSSMLTPASLLTLGIAALTSGWTAYTMWQQRSKKATDETKSALDEIVKSLSLTSATLYEASKASGAEIAQLRILYGVATDATKSTEERRKASKKLIDQYPEQFKNMGTESIMLGNAKTAYDKLTISILATARAQAAYGKIGEKAGLQIAIDESNRALQKELEIEKNINKEREKAFRSGTGGTAYSSVNAIQTVDYANSLGKVEKIQKQITNNLLERAKLSEDINALEGIAVSNQGNILDKVDKVKNKTNDIDKITDSIVKDSLNQYDQKLYDIQKKYDKIFKTVKEGDKLFDLAKENQEVEKLRVNIERFIDATKKISDISITGRSTVTTTFSSIPSIAPLQNSFAGFTASLSKGLEKDNKLENSISRIIERGFRQGIGGILDNITELGSDFKSVFTNVFGQLRNTLQGVFNDIIGTRLGDLFKSNFDDIDLGGLGNKVSQAVVAGAGLAGQLVSGMTSKTSALGQGLGGAISGAAMGTAILPGIGTAVGAVLGGLSGIFGAKKAREQERLQQEQLAESKRQTALQERIAQLSYTSSIVGSRTNLGTVTSIDRDAFGNIEGIVDGKNLKLIIERN